MNYNTLAYYLQMDGWLVLGPGMHNGLPFDLIGQRKTNLTQWNILVKSIPVMDLNAVTVWQNNFNYLSNTVKSWVWGKCFVLCLVAQQVDPAAYFAVQSGTFGQVGMLRIKGGGGRVMIADESTRQVFGDVPALPLDVHKLTDSTKRILYYTLSQP